MEESAMIEKKRLRTAVFAAAALSALLFLSGLAQPLSGTRPQNSSSRAVRDVGDAYFNWMKEDSLYLRVRLGLNVERLPDLTLAKAEKDIGRAKELLAQLEKIKPEELNHEEELSLDVLRLRLNSIVDSLRFYWFAFPVTPYTTPLNEVNTMFAGYVFKDKAAADHYLDLLNLYPNLIHQLRHHLEKQSAKGIVIPREEIDLIIPFLRALAGDVENNLLSVKPERLTALSPPDASAFQKKLANIIEEKTNPALGSLISYIEGEYRGKAPGAVGLGQYPGGKEFYAWLVKYHTALDLTPEEVHAIGLKEVEKINLEMDKVQATLGFKGTRSEFRDSLKKDPRFFPRTPEEVGECLMAHIRRIEPKLDLFFLRKPEAPYGVKRLEPEREGAQTFGIYEAPTAANPTGYYRYNGSRLPERSLLGAASLIYHELVPGHHFQISLSLENLEIPAFRRETFDNAYVEGWAEYAANLAGEMGMYADPYDLYGRLSMQMFLAVRLVVDPGMNALGWSRSKAVAFMRENLMETDEQIRTESLRYSCDMPGQALGYRLGYLKFLELGEKAKKELGESFDIRRFHDALLASGSLPLATLERHVDWFIKNEKGENRGKDAPTQ
jgi:uncharacterized protein (DUF885 family)